MRHRGRLSGPHGARSSPPTPAWPPASPTGWNFPTTPEPSWSRSCAAWRPARATAHPGSRAAERWRGSPPSGRPAGQLRQRARSTRSCWHHGGQAGRPAGGRTTTASEIDLSTFHEEDVPDARRLMPGRPTARCAVGRRAARRLHRGCGWTLRTGRRPGPVTTQLQKEFDERLSAAQRAFDARAAARAGSAQERLLPWIRGGRPDAAEWAAARQQATAAVAGVADEETACRELVGLLADLDGGHEVAVVEIGQVGVALTRVTLDPSGAPEFRRDQPVPPGPMCFPRSPNTPTSACFSWPGRSPDRTPPGCTTAWRLACPGGRPRTGDLPAGWLADPRARRLAGGQRVRDGHAHPGRGSGQRGWAREPARLAGGQDAAAARVRGRRGARRPRPRGRSARDAPALQLGRSPGCRVHAHASAESW